MQLNYGDYVLGFEDGGVTVEKGGKVLYFNRRPVSVTVKTMMAISQCYEDVYTSVEVSGGAVKATGTVATEGGSEFAFEDEYTLAEGEICVKRHVKVEKAGEDYGFSSKISLVMAETTEQREYDYFCPGNWYKQNEYAPDITVGKDMDCEYFWKMETRMALPLFSMIHKTSGESICFSRWASDMTLRNVDIARSENNIDWKLTTGAIGISKPSNQTVNYLYYGFAIRTNNTMEPQGLSIDYIYPGCDGQFSQGNVYSGLDFKEKPMNFKRLNHPVREGFEQSYRVGIYLGCKDGFQSMMRDSWRKVYDRLRDDIFEVDNEAFYRDCITLLDTYTREYGKGVGLPFACQLPNMDVSSISFQYGFVGQQPGIGLLLMRYGALENRKEMYEKGRKLLQFWVDRSMTDTGLPNMCFHPAIDDFEPYPYYIRMLADGVEAILEAYEFLKTRGEDLTEWLAYCEKVADWVVSAQLEDGSFYHAYNADGTGRMLDKGITPSIIRFLVQMYSVLKKDAYKEAARKAGEWSYEMLYKTIGYRGGTCDNATITDKESGIYAMWGFLALYDLTEEAKWLEAAVGAADYTETWTYAWNFPVVTPWSKHPFNKYGISGQSVITLFGGADVYMAACEHTYYRLYLLTGDEHYLDFAKLIAKNTRQSNDIDGSIGYIMRAVGHESGDFSEQMLRSQYHWLPWCTFVETEPVARLYDTFGVYEIEEAEKLPLDQRKAAVKGYDVRWR